MLPAAVAILELDDRDKCGMRAAAKGRPVDEARRRERSRLAAEPALTLEEGHQRLPLDDRPHAAVEDGVPDDAGKQCRDRRMFLDDR